MPRCSKGQTLWSERHSSWHSRDKVRPETSHSLTSIKAGSKDGGLVPVVLDTLLLLKLKMFPSPLVTRQERNEGTQTKEDRDSDQPGSLSKHRHASMLQNT